MTTQKRTAQGRFAGTEKSAEQKKKKAPEKKAAKPTKNCKRYAKKRVAEEWPGIVDELVKSAKSGSYNHTKLLVEVSGIKEEDVKPVKKRERGGVAKLLMERLKEKDVAQD